VSDERLLRAEEVAERLTVPTSWVREHTRSGEIPHVRLGRWVRYSTADVDAWIDECKTGGGPAFRRYEPRGRTTAARE
jgi:excisionase family DNA binding protein